MEQSRVYKVALTGGPCGGKTTGQARLTTFFENLGWKVLRVPETATVLFSGGIKFSEMDPEQAFKFQENLLKTMISIEDTFFEAAKGLTQNCLIICDRGVMDASTYMSKEDWEVVMRSNGWKTAELRDNRYDHIIHMVSAANGAEKYYSNETNACRSESLEEARMYDLRSAMAWVGHPYFDVIDNSSQDFQSKVCRMIECICQKLGVDTGDRFSVSSRKVKFLVRGPLPADSEFPPFQDFDVEHDYLQTSDLKTQARIRKRKQKGCESSYIHTSRRQKTNGQLIEVKTPLTYRDYTNMLEQRDKNRVKIFKRRRCFLINDQYFQLDIYKQTGHPRCYGLMLLETYTSLTDDKLLKILPKFLTIEKEVTGNPDYSMFNLSLRNDCTPTDENYNDFNIKRDKTAGDRKNNHIPSILCGVSMVVK